MAGLDEIVFIGKVAPRSSTEDKADKERMKLSRTFKKMNVPYLFVGDRWPRDSYVYFNGEVHKQNQHGNYADGGFLFAFPGFLLCSESVALDDGLDFNTRRYFAHRTMKLWRLYRSRADILPTPNLSLNPHMAPHIDYVTLPIPQKNVLFVDEDYFLEYQVDVEDFFQEKVFSNRDSLQ